MAVFIDPNQAQFRARNDDGNETGATWIAALNTNWSQNTGQNFRVRITTKADAGASSNSPIAPQLWASLNGGAYFQVTASSTIVKLVLSSQFTDGTATTQQISSGLGLTYVAGSMQESSSSAVSRSMVAGINDAEDEWCLQITSSGTANGDTITLRQRNGLGNVYATYTQTPSITVVWIAPPGGMFAFF